MEYKGQIEGFPKEVVERMLDCQEEQGNKRDVNVFEYRNWTEKKNGGFDWEHTNEGIDFWHEVITKENFNVFFKKYPKQTTYYYKGKPYKIVCESKIKLKGILYLIALMFSSKLGKDFIKEHGGKWVDVVIYECLYENPDGQIWVREKQEFYRNFKKVE